MKGVLIHIACLALPLWVAGRAEAEGTIRVAFEGFRNDQGDALCALFDADGWESQEPREGYAARISQGQAVCTFESLSQGRYAVAVYHDENRNRSLDTGIMGIPSEGFAFSNTPRLIFGLPSFRKASVRLAEEAVTELHRSLRYLLP